MKISINRNELLSFANNDVAFYQLDLSRISTIFLFQIFKICATRTLNHHQILDEVKYLEGVRSRCNTKHPNEFKKGLLKGYMKKHFMDASFIARNISNHFSVHFGGNDRMDNIINDVKNENNSDIIDNKFINKLTHEMTFGAYENRAGLQKLTGEWIIYKLHDDKKYYLTLGSHEETDEAIYKRICDAIDMDFNFLLLKETN